MGDVGAALSSWAFDPISYFLDWISFPFELLSALT